jgi:hypothetical protein
MIAHVGAFPVEEVLPVVPSGGGLVLARVSVAWRAARRRAGS